MTTIGMLLQAWMPRLNGLLQREEGQDGVEYAVVAALVIAVVAGAYAVGTGALATDIKNALASIGALIP